MAIVVMPVVENPVARRGDGVVLVATAGEVPRSAHLAHPARAALGDRRLDRTEIPPATTASRPRRVDHGRVRSQTSPSREPRGPNRNCHQPVHQTAVPFMMSEKIDAGPRARYTKSPAPFRGRALRLGKADQFLSVRVRARLRSRTMAAAPPSPSRMLRVSHPFTSAPVLASDFAVGVVVGVLVDGVTAGVTSH